MYAYEKWDEKSAKGTDHVRNAKEKSEKKARFTQEMLGRNLKKGTDYTRNAKKKSEKGHGLHKKC